MRTGVSGAFLGAGCGRRGVSLIELTMVVAILALLSAIAIPRFAGSLTAQRARSAGNRVAADLAYARRQAKIRGQACTVEFEPAAGRYVLRQIQSIDHPAVDYTVDLTNSPYRAKLLSVDLGGDALIRFDGFGVPDSGGSIVVSVGARVCTLMVDGNTGESTVN